LNKAGDEEEVLEMKLNKAAQAHVENLKRELGEVRRSSLSATRKGDYMRVARLNAQAQGLTKALAEADGIISIDLI
jgi:molybdopterin converting factor small subunit